jgi:hypothetical protein
MFIAAILLRMAWANAFYGDVQPHHQTERRES